MSERNETLSRVPQAERSARMQRRLAQAAYEVIRDGGYVHFRTAQQQLFKEFCSRGL